MGSADGLADVAAEVTVEVVSFAGKVCTVLCPNDAAVVQVFFEIERQTGYNYPRCACTLLHGTRRLQYWDKLTDLQQAAASADRPSLTLTIVKDAERMASAVWFRACEHADISKMASLRQSGRLDLDARDDQGQTALHLAARLGHWTVMKLLLRFGATKSPVKDGQTPLHWACRHGRLHAVQLMEEAVGLWETDGSGNTGLHLAIEAGQVEVANYFLRRVTAVAEADTPNERGETSLLLAAKGGHTDLVRSLLHLRANKDHRDLQGRSARDWAISQRKTDIVEVLLQASIWEEAWDENLLQQAVLHWDDALVDLLLKSGLRPDVSDFQRAASEGCVGILALLLAHRADVEDSTRPSKDQPLYCAAEEGNLDMLKLQLNCGARPDAPGKRRKDRCIALSTALQKKRHDLAETLLRHGSSGYMCRDVLKVAVASEDIDAVQLLTKYRADLSGEILAHTLKTGSLTMLQQLQSHHPSLRPCDQVLHQAILKGDASRVELLIGLRASIEGTSGPRSKTAMQVAMMAGHAGVMEFLLEKKAVLRFDEDESSGETLLTTAVVSSTKEVLELLLAHRAPPDSLNKRGMSPLHLAAVHGLDAMITVLLEHRAGPDVQSAHQGHTPLHFAAIEGHVDAVRALLSSRAAVNLQNSLGYTPLQYARARRHRQVAQELELNSAAESEQAGGQH